MTWGILIEFSGWICPLTTLENEFYRNNKAGEYSTGFIEHYIIPIIYPEGLTRDIQGILGITLIIINLIIYTFLIKNMGPYRDN